MSVRKLTASLFMTLAMLGVGNTTVKAQEYFPAVDPFAFDPDFRWFEPIYDADLADMKPKKRANTGWFATYDKLALYASRPELTNPSASDTRLDKGSGNRYEVGYMLPGVDNGWMFSTSNLNVNANDTVQQERLNRYDSQALGGSSSGGGGSGGGGGGGGGSGGSSGGTQPIDPRFPADGRFSLPEEDRNNPGFFTRFYDIGQSLNDLSYDNYELNKTWRMEPYHYGGILEPMVGFRWMRIKDYNFKNNYSTPADVDGVPLLTFGEAEQLITDSAITSNELLTGQVGFRYTKFVDRFTFASDFRFFTGGTLQSSQVGHRTDITFYNTPTLVPPTTLTLPKPGQAPVLDLHRATAIKYSRNDEFTIGFDVRGELNYQLTKMITVRAGFQVIDVAMGLWRGGPGPNNGGTTPFGGSNNQDLVMAGGTFGLTINR